ncbi:hypothetical protein [Chryseobacterium caseinilyticum]|uniref:DUF4374 domain-containing protein n=1 Tax=Chryseobacterium caseinilyticum TaxID=2771428 RepID=A0ABR8ZF16_9FLAO|nr:hypothetical protein [Chryseobacterium caseinilyticum]MBD8083901.1 hypothetical protein [Chryseobacterium caseinilyticum]
MKFLNITTLAAISAFFLISCDKETCEYVTVCEPLGSNTGQSGISIVTYNADNPTDFVAAIYDTRNNASVPAGTDWAPALGTGGKITKPADWTLGKLGRIFGIATDKNANVYLATSGVYGQNFLNTPYQNAVPGRIYKATAGTYSTTPFVDLPISYASSAGSLNGVGNVAYDKINNQLFATNLDDGKIYRISMTGSILQTYDPFAADSGTPDITIQDERIWGIGVNYENGNVKVYFPRVTVPSTLLANRNLYSITLNSTGAMPTSAPALEITNLPGHAEAITDLEFSADTKKIILSERGDPHDVIAFSYNNTGSGWNFNTQYAVGGFTGKNAAGGVDFQYIGDDKNLVQCEEFVWVSGNYLEAAAISPGRVYGIQGIKYPGNTVATAPSTDLFIDYNPPVYNFAMKGDIGDVDVIDADQCTCISK